MAIYEHDPLSIWELGLRWLELDPDGVGAAQLPANCRDLLRDLCLAGLQYINPHDASGAEVVGLFVPFINVEIESKVHKALQVAVAKRVYDRTLLDSVYYLKDQVAQWCILTRRTFPFFWYRSDEADYYLGEWRRQWREEYPFELPPERAKPVAKQAADTTKPAEPMRPKARKLTSKQLDRIATQRTAKILWDEYPTMTIADLIKRKEIRIDCNGAIYEEKTLRGWVSKVDPRSVAQKTGRPKKKQ